MATQIHNVSPDENLDKFTYLFGKKIAQSLSPELHAVIYSELGLRWAQKRLDSDDIPQFLDFLNHPKCCGASVTMPNKVNIMQHLDHITPECRDVGACNTIYIRPSASHGGRRLICGTNTDVIGIRDSFYRSVPNPDITFHQRPALVLGSGGAARSAVYALRKWMNVTNIYLVNRFAHETQAVIEWCQSRGYGEGLVHVTSVDQARSLEAPGAVVACVPDFPPSTAEELLARNIFEEMLKKEKKGVMLEMCYNPTPWTQLLAVAEAEGWQVIPGTEALIWQGIEQDRYWTEREAADFPLQKVQEFIAAKLFQRPRL